MTNINQVVDADGHAIVNSGNHTAVNGTLYLSGADSENPDDTELWKTDGTPQGTTRIKDINPGSNGSSPSYLTAVDSTVYFAANDGSGEKLWKSDGTEAGTVLVEDVNARTFSNPKGFEVIDSTLYFTTYDSDNLGELWKTDGTSSGTTLIKSGLMASQWNSRPTGVLKAVETSLYFVNYDNGSGVELWKHDSESGSTVLVKDIALGESYGFKNGSYPKNLTAAGPTLYFVAENSDYGGELWKSDGTTAGTVLVEDIRAGSAYSNPSNLTAIGSEIYFGANDGVHGTELWKSDGTEAGTSIVKDIRPGSSPSSPNSLVAFGSTLYFRAYDDTNGSELWKSDGTSSGTALVKDIRAGSSGSSPSSLTVAGSRLFFRASTDAGSNALWTTDGSTNGTYLIQDAVTNSSFTEVSNFEADGARLFFNSWNNDANRDELYILENLAVVTGDTTGSGDEGSTINGTLSATDVEGLTDGTVFSIASADQPSNGVATIDPATGAWAYTPNANFNGTDSFSVTITDDLDGTTTQAISLQIYPIDDAPDVSNSSPSVAATTESTTNAEVEKPIVVLLPDGVAKPAVRVATQAIVMPEEFAEKVVDLGVQTPVYSIDFEIPLPSVFRYNPLTKSFQRTKRTKANLPLAPLLGDLSLSDGLGRRVKSRRPLYFGIDGAGVISDLSYDPLRNAGARFYDTDGDESADFLSLGLVDGGFGDKDGIVNGVIVDPSMPGIVDLTPSITEQTNRFLKIGDPSNTAPAALALQASLTTRSKQVTTVGYVILNEGEDPSIVEDINTFKERARTLFSSLESNDVVLNDSMRFEREFLLRNGQSVRFFAITDHSLNELTSLKDARFSFLEADVDAITGTASIGGGGGFINNISFSLSFLEGDQNLSALIAQEQTVAPLLDFTAFSETDTITGAIIQAREAEEDAITGFYRVLDIDGSVLSADGSLLTPGDAGYAAAALRDANQVATFSDLSVADGQSSSTDFSLQDSGTFAPFAQVNGHTFFAFSEANADGLSHFRSLGTNLFGLEDQLGGGDLDFDDHIIGFNISGLTRSDQAAVA